MFKRIGPGIIVAAAFIGPGTVTACTLAGAQYGYGLLWAMLLSIIATVVLQEMSARLGIITQKGLADVVRLEIKSPFTRNLIITIILSAIVIGNAAYEGGNIAGGTLGLEAILGTAYTSYYPLGISLFAFVLLFIGNYKILERIFIALVLLMSISFLITSVLTRPDIISVLKGLFVPLPTENNLLMIIALVGTTVVPYNLFLHAALVSEKWKSRADLKLARRDTVLSIVLGGIVSMSVIVAAAAIPNKEIENVIDLAKGLEPLYGSTSRYFMGLGLFAAGITSAITAPLAAAYVAKSCFGWKGGLKNYKFRLVWMIILFLGSAFMYFNIRPIKIIQFAQVANGILLPVIALFLLWAVNRKAIMGKFINTKFQNILGLLIVFLAFVLGMRSIVKVLGLF